MTDMVNSPRCSASVTGESGYSFFQLSALRNTFRGGHHDFKTALGPTHAREVGMGIDNNMAVFAHKPIEPVNQLMLFQHTTAGVSAYDQVNNGFKSLISGSNRSAYPVKAELFSM